jgi:hypothetical protein
VSTCFAAGRHGLCSQGANSVRPYHRDPGGPDGSPVCLTPPQILIRYCRLADLPADKPTQWRECC